MNRGELIVGYEYIVKGFGVGTYAGVHDGVLVAGDGTEFHGGKNALRFVFKGKDDQSIVRLIGDGREVQESLAAKQERERQKTAIAAKSHEMTQEVIESLATHGVTAGTGYLDESDVNFSLPNLYVGTDYDSITVDDVTIMRMTFGTLRNLIKGEGDGVNERS